MLLPGRNFPQDGRSLISEILCGVPTANGKSCGSDVERGVDDDGVGEENYAVGVGCDGSSESDASFGFGACFEPAACFERGAYFERGACFGHGAHRDVKEPSWKPGVPILPDEKRAPVDQAEPRCDETPVEEGRTQGAEHPHAPARQLVGLSGQTRKGAP